LIVSLFQKPRESNLFSEEITGIDYVKSTEQTGNYPVQKQRRHPTKYFGYAFA
jgi:hypothetical protein